MAICVSCRRPVCASCSTLWEGIHCCVDCLAERRGRAVRQADRLRTAAVILGTLALAAALTFVRAWIGAFLAGAS